MRRVDREVTSREEVAEIMNRCDVCRYGLANNNMPYIVPLHFVYEFVNDSLIIYSHCANEGRKLEMIKENAMVCFEMDNRIALIEGEHACNYSAKYESVMGTGEVVICSDFTEKERAFQMLMKRYAPHRTFSFTEEELDRVKLLKLTVKEYTSKHRLA